MAEAQVFEFKGNAITHFRVLVHPFSLSVSTLTKKGGAPANTWNIDFSNVAEIKIHERVGASTTSSGIYLKPRSGGVVMCSWAKSIVGARKSDGKIYYEAAAATLRAISQKRPDLGVTMGPGLNTSYFIGAILQAVILAFLLKKIAGDDLIAFYLGGAIALLGWLISLARSGAFEKTLKLSLADAAVALATRAASL